MSKRDISLYIVDIFIAIDKINRYTINIDDSEELQFKITTINNNFKYFILLFS